MSPPFPAGGRKFFVMLKGTAIAVLLTLTSCATVPPADRFAGLRVGMTEEEFLHQKERRAFIPDIFPEWMNRSGLPERGASFPPSSYRTTNIDGDHWSVWVYDVYRPIGILCCGPDHREYAVFRNGRLETWGAGMPPQKVAEK